MRGILPGALLAAIGLVVTLGPWSPLALSWADAMAGRGDGHRVVSAYRLVAHMGATETLRERAAFRVAVLTAVDGTDPQGAIRALSTYIRQHPEGAGAGEALSQLAGFYDTHLNAPARAARAWRQAADAAPDHELAAEWLLRSADAYEVLGKDRQARELRDRVARQYPEHAAEAWLASARLLLERGDSAAAYEFYQQVATSIHAGSLSAMGRLGMSVCLEHSGDLEAALAELDEAVDVLPEAVWRQRRDRVRERHQAFQHYEQTQQKNQKKAP